MKIDRQTVRDVGFAVLLALPTAALLRPAASQHDRAAVTQHLQIVVADSSPLRQRFSLSG
jgi:hypothetical protein